MKILKIYSDLSADDAEIALLRDGIAPHQLVRPAKPAASVLEKSEADPALADADIAFGQPDASGVLQASGLRWLQVSSAGYTRYDTDEFRNAAAKRGVVVTNSSSVYAPPCAEHVFAFMLAQARRLPQALKTRTANDSEVWMQLRNGCVSLCNQRVLILGYGAIAACLVKLLKPFEMEIVALRRKPRGDELVKIIREEELSAALADADHVVNILPANADSSCFMTAARFASMKKGAAFYNIGRGSTVDQDALLAVLRSGQLGAAWLDVTDPEPLPDGHPLLNQPNCFVTPHTAGGHRNETHTLVRHFLENFRRFLKGDSLRDRVI